MTEVPKLQLLFGVISLFIILLLSVALIGMCLIFVNLYAVQKRNRLVLNGIDEINTVFAVLESLDIITNIFR